MIVGLGVDAFDVSRMERELHKGNADFLPGLFTSQEIDWCRSQPRPAAHFAAHFALKEATFKALGLSDTSGASWTDVEWLDESRGDGSVVLRGRARDVADRAGVSRIVASFAFTRGVAVASAVLESCHDDDLP